MNPGRQVMTHEVVSALIVLVHGALWLAPTQTFAVSGNYAVMASIASENIWGGAFLLGGAAWCLAILSHRLTPRRAGLTFGGAALLWMGVSFWMSNPATIIGWVLIIVAAGTFVTRIELR